MALQHSPSIVTSGLVLYLDAGNPRSYSGSGTTWADVSGNNYNGTLINGPTYTSGTGGYFNFDGVDDRIDVNITSTPMQTSGPLTLSCWMYRNGDGMVFSAGGYYGLFAGGGFWYWNGNPNWVSYSCPVAVPSSTWCHYCLVYNNSTNPIFYINGVAYTSTGTYAAPSPFGSSIFRIGEYTVYTPYSPFNGRVAVSQFYNRALSSAEITQNFNALRGRYGV